ncbi:hypothetical protein [Flavobacterium selenitireducens]|uniref:hypothetical protein n=1 Tax=Flavobacterium selenitireducens TaxID=2722704 RepID=UPI00168B02C0|nr:hypothetical protein [Flavobacterium selenitireducens]MBD3581373.1 hypothetical protein [Flavobacterium selenitireducens]
MDNQENKTDHEHEFDGKKDRNFYQKPFDDVTDPLPQIDEQSASLSEKDSTKNGASDENQTAQTETQPEPAKADDINEKDPRDQGDSLRDWDSEHNRSSRQR